jgi:hypothetical protein
VFWTLGSAERSRKKRHAWLTCVAILHALIYHSRYHESFVTDSALADTLDPENVKCRKLRRLAKGVLQDAWAMWRKENRKDRELSPNNFFKGAKYNETAIHALTKRYVGRIDAAIRPVLS